MMRLTILNPLIPRTPKVGRETSENKQFSESNFYRKNRFSGRQAKLLHAQNSWENGKGRWKLVEILLKLKNITNSVQ
jgi:hypothetical protein